MTNKLESSAFYVILATVILAPLIFWPSPYLALGIVKTTLIALGVLAATILCLIIAFKEKQLASPPGKFSLIGLLLSLSLILSALLSGAFFSSFFGGEGELATASFLIILFLAAWTIFTLVKREARRVVFFYIAIIASFLLLFLFHGLRFWLGTDFASFSILSSLTATVFGNWYSLGAYALVVGLITFLALILLPHTPRIKTSYWVLFALSMLTALVVNDPRAWGVAIVVYLGLAIYLPTLEPQPENLQTLAGVKRLAWVPLAVCLVSILISWQGRYLAGPIIDKLEAGHFEFSLPWRATLDVTSDTIKDRPLFGVGPNRFTTAYLAHKPAGINSTNAWQMEFRQGFGLIPSFGVTQGLVGLGLWIVFLVMLGSLAIKTLRKLPTAPYRRFIIISSLFGTLFLWLMTLISVPSVALLFLTFVFTGIFLGTGGGANFDLGSLSPRVFSGLYYGLLVIGIVWGLIYIRQTTASVYEGGGWQHLDAGQVVAAETDFNLAHRFDSSDRYWRAATTAKLLRVNQLVATVTTKTGTSTSETIAADATKIINAALADADKAVAADKTSYNNYVLQAKVLEWATEFKLAGGYDKTVATYLKAIQLNPADPSLYLSLARWQGLQGRLDDAMRTANTALALKNNNPNTLFLLSNLERARKNTDNAEYWLGLAYVQAGQKTEAIAQFKKLSGLHPDNQELKTILKNLEGN